LRKGDVFRPTLQTLQLNFLKGTLGVKQSVPNWAVQRECGQEPLQYYWFRAYHSWFTYPLLDLQADSQNRARDGEAPLRPPRYPHLDLPMHVIRNVSRFCLRALTLAVESSIWCCGNAHCDNRSCAAVQNEVQHDALFHCQDLFVCPFRKKSSFLFSPFLPAFFNWSFSVEDPYILLIRATCGTTCTAFVSLPRCSAL